MGARKKLKLLQPTAKTPAKDVLAQKHSRLREKLRIIETASNPIIITDDDNRIVCLNSGAGAILGHADKELLGKRLDEQFHLDNHSNSSQEEFSSRLRGMRSDGEPFDIAALSHPIDVGQDRLNVVTLGIDETNDKSIRAAEILRDILSQEPRAGKTLKVSEDLYRSTIDSMADLIHVVDRNLTVHLVNDTFIEWCRELGLPTEVLGKGIYEVFPFLSEKVADEYNRVFESGKMLVTEESHYITGKEIVTETRKIPVYEGKEVTNVVTVVRDITANKTAQRALKESEERFRTMADFTYDWEYWLGTNGKCIYVSPSIEKTIGYQPAEFAQDFGLLRRITHPEDVSILDSHLSDGSQPGRVTSIDFRVTSRNGEIRWINHVCQPVYSSEGAYLGRRASNRDITDRKRAEDALRRECDRAQLYLDVAGTVLLVINQDERVVLINRKGSELLGCEELEVVGANWFERFVPAKYREQARTVFRKLMAGDTGTTQYAESRVIAGDGQIRTIAWYNTVIKDETGKISGTISSGLDITERQHLEKVHSALFEISEATNLAGSLDELLRNIHGILGRLIDTTNFYVALYDAGTDTYTFPYVVDQYHERADLEPEQLKKTLTDYVRRTGAPLLADEAKDQELLARGEVAIVGQPSKIWLGVPLITSQGVIGVVAVQSYTDSSLYQESDMDLMTFVSRHVSMAVERKLAEEALRESEEHYRTLVQTMNEGLVARDNSNTILFANQKFCAMLGYKISEVVDGNLADFLDDENRDILLSQPPEQLADGPEPYEIEWLRRDGSRVTTIMSPVARRDGVGTIIGSIAVITDISERKRSEDKLRMATELLRTEREALTQKNIALKEILDHIEKERQDYKQAICRDVSQAMEPLLTRLKKLTHGERGRDIESLQSQLDAVLAKDVDVFRDRYAKLSPRELEICDLIKSKMSSKEISERLNVSLLTVHKHREQIRRKLGLTAKGINLSAYLQSH